MENGDTRPTDGAYKVFGELSGELQGHLADLEQIIQTEGPGVNQVLRDAGLDGLPQNPQ